MEQGSVTEEQWNFENTSSEIEKASDITIKGVVTMLSENIGDDKSVISLGSGDPSHFPCYKTSIIAQDAILHSLTSSNFNSYSPKAGLHSARRAVAEYISEDVPHNVSEHDVFMTVGCIQAIEIVMRSVNHTGANILLPRPGFPYYESFAACNNTQVRHYNLLPQQQWEVDLDSLDSLSDHNTVAIVIINPGNPCGNVYKRQHLQQIAEKARKLRIMVIADEVYGRLCFGSNAFVAMGVFASIVPVVSVSSISKRWCVPGWRLGWIVTHDPNRILHKTRIMKKIIGCVNITPDPPTFIQAALAEILKKTNKDYFSKIIGLLKEAAEICYDRINEIPCLTCPNKPQGSMFIMVQMNVSLLEDISDDMDFCIKLAKQESVIILPGVTLGMKNWLRISFAVELSMLEDGLAKIKSFCQRHSKTQFNN